MVNYVHYQDYAHFLNTEASLMCGNIVGQSLKNPEEALPHQLQLDCGGSITFSLADAIIEGGEIKSSSSSKHTFPP